MGDGRTVAFLEELVSRTTWQADLNFGMKAVTQEAAISSADVSDLSFDRSILARAEYPPRDIVSFRNSEPHEFQVRARNISKHEKLKIARARTRSVGNA